MKQKLDTPPLPKVAHLPFPSVKDFEWNEMPLGIGADGEPLVWDTTRISHLLVAGNAGSGKSMMQRAMLLHALQSPRWEVILIDPKRVELSMYKNADGTLLYATEEVEMLDALRYAQQQMVDRYALVVELGVPDYSSLPESPPALMVMIDELSLLLSETGDKEVDARRKEARELIEELVVDTGGSTGVHLVLATQRPDCIRSWFPSARIRHWIVGRIGMGNMHAYTSNMVLDDDMIGTLTPAKPRGRGVFRDLHGYHKMQGYFLADNQVESAVTIANAIRSGETTVAAAVKEMPAPAEPETPRRRWWNRVPFLGN